MYTSCIMLWTLVQTTYIQLVSTVMFTRAFLSAITNAPAHRYSSLNISILVLWYMFVFMCLCLSLSIAVTSDSCSRNSTDILSIFICPLSLSWSTACIHLRISRPAYKSKWTFKVRYLVFTCVLCTVLKTDQLISRIENILSKICPIFFDLYGSMYGNSRSKIYLAFTLTSRGV